MLAALQPAAALWSPSGEEHRLRLRKYLNVYHNSCFDLCVRPVLLGSVHRVASLSRTVHAVDFIISASVDGFLCGF